MKTYSMNSKPKKWGEKNKLNLDQFLLTLICVAFLLALIFISFSGPALIAFYNWMENPKNQGYTGIAVLVIWLLSWLWWRLKK